MNKTLFDLKNKIDEITDDSIDYHDHYVDAMKYLFAFRPKLKWHQKLGLKIKRKLRNCIARFLKII